MYKSTNIPHVPPLSENPSSHSSHSSPLYPVEQSHENRSDRFVQFPFWHGLEEQRSVISQEVPVYPDGQVQTLQNLSSVPPF